VRVNEESGVGEVVVVVVMVVVVLLLSEMVQVRHQ